MTSGDGAPIATGDPVVIIGGGPGGLMAAERLAVAGADVTVYDRMPSVGRKLVLAGRSGLNLTHSEPLEQLLARYGASRDRLEPAIRRFEPDALRAWCSSLGEPTFVGTSGRVFPESFRATPLLRAWLARLASMGVGFEVRHRWTGWAERVDGGVARPTFEREDGSSVEVDARAVILALGGGSWPGVGSDGRWVDTLGDRGVEVVSLEPANCGFTVGWSDDFVERFAGAPLKNVRWRCGECVSRGEAVITDTGLEGGAIYELGAELRAAWHAKGNATVTIDLCPDRTVERLVQQLERRRPKDSLSSVLTRTLGLSTVAVGLLREANANRLPRESASLAVAIKELELVVGGPEPIDRAISTAGGVSWDEIDDTFMLRRLPGVFVVGEMIDWEAPTGGYLLQATFSTAVAAADGALAWLATTRPSDRGQG